MTVRWFGDIGSASGSDSYTLGVRLLIPAGEQSFVIGYEYQRLEAEGRKFDVDEQARTFLVGIEFRF